MKKHRTWSALFRVKFHSRIKIISGYEDIRSPPLASRSPPLASRSPPLASQSPPPMFRIYIRILVFSSLESPIWVYRTQIGLSRLWKKPECVRGAPPPILIPKKNRNSIKNNSGIKLNQFQNPPDFFCVFIPEGCCGFFSDSAEKNYPFQNLLFFAVFISKQ